MKAKMARPSRKTLLTAVLGAALLAFGADQPAVRVAPSDSVGPRELEPQTRTAVVRDYLAAWHDLRRAMEQNNPELLDVHFLGVARQELSGTVTSQRKLQFQTRYQDRKHDIHVVLYSPEGLSVQLLDNVEYDVQLLEDGKVMGTQHISTRCVAVLTPTEVRWKVRIFQMTPL